MLFQKQQQPECCGGAYAALEGEGPGEYVVVSKVAVSREADSLDDVVAKLPVGAQVKVLEVRVVEGEKRVRGRLQFPAGWISLMNTDTGRRWAARAVVCPCCPRSHALRRCPAEGCSEQCTACQHVCTGGGALECTACGYKLCTHCLQDMSPLKAWTFQVTANVTVKDLGFWHFREASQRVRVCGVQPGGWAEKVGLRPCDELTAINGVSVDQVTAAELDSVLQKIRPLEFTFVYDGAGDEAVRDEKAVAIMTLSNVDLRRLCGDQQLLGDVEAVIRQAVAAEAAHGAQPEDVSLGLHAEGTNLVVRCVVGRLGLDEGPAVRERLARSQLLGSAVTLGLQKCTAVKTVATGPVRVLRVEVATPPPSPRGWRTAANTLLRRLKRSRSQPFACQSFCRAEREETPLMDTC